MSAPSLSRSKVICLGDFMLDEFIYGEVTRISPEAPIPILRQTRSFFTLGGAGNVVRNLSSLGQDSIVIGVLDQDFSGKTVQALLNDLPHTMSYLITDKNWCTPKKTRLSSSGQQLLRLDLEHKNMLTQALEDEILKTLKQHIHEASFLILSDYDKGNLTQSLVEKVITLAKAHKVFVIADPKDKDFAKYNGANLLTPNLKEFRQACGKDVVTPGDISQEASLLKKTHGIESMLVTLGAEGMLLLEGDHTPLHLPSHAREVFDVSGAGDTVLASLAASLAEGHSLEESARFANKAAGIVVGKIGTATVTKEEVHMESVWDEKVMPLAQSMEKVSLWKGQNRIVGFTNGCFDLLHLGHIHLLRQARGQCDKLIVAINSDDSVRRLKGDARPIQNEHVRAHVLAALEMVDAVILFEEDTPLTCIEHILPNVLIKGADYTKAQVVGGDIVCQQGGRIFLADLKHGFSTTRTVEKMRD